MPKLPTAREAMTEWRLTLQRGTNLLDAIRDLVDRRAAGAPVVDADGVLVGVLTEKDSIRVLANRAYGEVTGGHVDDVMSKVGAAITPEMDLLAVAHVFLQTNFPVLPVTEDGRLVGRVSRQGLLRELQRFIRARRQKGVELATPSGPPTSIEQMQRAAPSHTPQQLAELLRERHE